MSTEDATPLPPKPTRAKTWHNVAVRLADEGVPVRAIVRALMMSHEDVREVLEAASERGMLLNVPRDDWPPGTRRDERQPDVAPLKFEDDHMIMLVMSTFTLTQSMAKLFSALLRRPGMTKAALHLVVSRDDGAAYPSAGKDPSHIKIVDVYVCKIRERMKAYAAKSGASIEIITDWGRGYRILPAHKEIAFRMLGIKHDTFSIPAEAVSDTPH